MSTPEQGPPGFSPDQIKHLPSLNLSFWDKGFRPRVFRSKMDGSIAVEDEGANAPSRGENWFTVHYAGPVAGRLGLYGRYLTLEFVVGNQILDFEELVPGCDRPHEIEGER